MTGSAGPRALDAIAGWPVPTAAAAVVGPGGVLETYGPIEQPFRLASVTKLITVLAALIAVEEEAIGLADPVATEVVTGATVRHLMAHASGLAPERVMRAADPGTRRIYSNAGIDLLAETVALGARMPFSDYVALGLTGPLGMTATTVGERPSRDGVSTVTDLARFAGELLAPTGIVHPSTLAEATSVQFPGLRGVLPGYGRQDPNDWGLGFELKDGKVPHWTGPANSPATFGHFGQSGTMLWVDPVARLALVSLTDRPFDVWAAAAWPELSDAVLATYA